MSAALRVALPRALRLAALAVTVAGTAQYLLLDLFVPEARVGEHEHRRARLHDL